MALLSEMVDEVESHLLGFTSRVERMTTLSSSIPSSGQATITVADTGVLARGPVQVGDELLMVTSFDSLTGEIPAWGRGYGMSVAAEHEAGERVTFQPVFPRSNIQRAVVEAVDDLYPDLFGVKRHSIELEVGVYTHPLPAETQDVLSCRVDTGDDVDGWLPVTHYDFQPWANEDDFPTGRAVELPMSLRGTVDMVLQVKPAITASTADWAEMGLFPSAKTVLIHGALYRCLNSLDLGWVDSQSASAAYRRREGAASASEQAGRQYALYQAGLERERRRMLASLDDQIQRRR